MIYRNFISRENRQQVITRSFLCLPFLITVLVTCHSPRNSTFLGATCSLLGSKNFFWQKKKVPSYSVTLQRTEDIIISSISLILSTTILNSRELIPSYWRNWFSQTFLLPPHLPVPKHLPLIVPFSVILSRSPSGYLKSSRPSYQKDSVPSIFLNIIFLSLFSPSTQ